MRGNGLPQVTKASAGETRDYLPTGFAFLTGGSLARLYVGFFGRLRSRDDCCEK